VDKKTPPALKGDPTRLSQVLINLVGNSIKFTDEDGVVQVSARLAESHGRVHRLLFQVKDNGIGIAKDKQDSIFESFSQAESHTTRKYGGTGLGLTIVKRLTELMGGSIWLESTEGKGTTFFIELPVKEGSAENLEQEKQIAKAREPEEDIELLIVEDNPLNMQLAEDVISNWSQKVKIDKAFNGSEAIMKTTTKPYDLILMDLSLPEMDGYAITKVVRKRGNKNHKTPIIAMTAHAMSSEKEKSKQAGMDGFLTKPFEPEDLYATIYAHSSPGNAKEQAARRAEVPDSTVGQGPEKVNISYLERIYGGAKEKIAKMLDMYLEAVPKEIEAVKKSYAEKNWENLNISAHSLKPKMLYLGLKTMQQKALDIEKMAEGKKDSPQLKERINTLIERWAEAEKELITILGQLK
jgi:CheY-like chemotaxis protein